MRLFHTFIIAVFAVSAAALAIPERGQAEIHHVRIPSQSFSRDDTTTAEHSLHKRQSPATLARFAKTWFKIGKTLFNDYKKIAQENDKDGAGFHRDFGDLVDAQLPAPPDAVENLDDKLPENVR